MTYEHKCGNCQYYHEHSQKCIFQSPVQISSSDWGCKQFQLSFSYIYDLERKYERMEKRIKEVRKLVRQLKTKLNKLQNK